MSTSKMHTPSKSRGAMSALAGSRGSPHRGALTVRFQTGNPFEALAGTMDTGSDGSAFTGSPTSSGGSMSLLGRNDPGRAPTTPSRGQVQDYELQAAQRLAQHGMSPEQVRRMTISGSNMSPTFTSQMHSRAQSLPNYSNGSPQKLTLSRLSQLQASGDLEVAHLMHRRDSLASQRSQDTRNSPRRPSFSSNLRAPTMLQPADGINTTSMSGVPEALAVQELAFRQGQHDHGSSRDRVPSNPFTEDYDVVWAENYKLGKVIGGTPIVCPAAAPSASHQNYEWPVLINPYTQDLEHPNGSVDLRWTRKICEIALNCMEALIRLVCKRPTDWQKLICDIPAPSRQALMAFPDLCDRYEALKRDAHQALGGGIPKGY